MPKKIHLHKFTMAQVHQHIFQSESLTDAADRLGVKASTLSCHLRKFMYQDNSLTYEYLKGISLEEGAQIFGRRYESLMEASRVDLKKLTLRVVHEEIQQSTNATNAAGRLGVKPRTLASHLGRFMFQGNSLNYQFFKGISLEKGAQIFGERYESPMEFSRVDLKKLTLRMIHEAIQYTDSLDQAAIRLGDNTSTFASHLGKFFYQGDSITYEFLKALSLENGAEIFGARYESPMNALRMDLKKLTLRLAHEVIKQSTSLSDAAGRLGVQPPTLACHLIKCIHQGHSLTYDLLKEFSLENGAEIFGESYDLPMEVSRIDLKMRTLRMVHEAIQLSESLSGAASRLGVLDATLARHLGKFLHQGNPLTYEFLKGISLANGAQTFEERYDSLMDASRVDLNKFTLRQVHDVIHQSASFRGASGRLGVFHSTLARHLGRFLHQGNSLTYEYLKGISLEEGAQMFGERYESTMAISRVDLKKLTLKMAHKAIQQSTSLSDAACRLGVYDGTLRSHLGKFKYQGNSLTYEYLKGIFLEEGAQMFGERYESPMLVSRVDLKKFTLNMVHNVIQQSTSLSDAAGRLGVRGEALASHLGKFIHQGTPLTYPLLKGISLENGAGIFGERYESPMDVSQVDLSMCTILDIHKEFLMSKSISEVASRFGVDKVNLKKHLYWCLPHAREGDVFRFLNKLTEEEARRKYGLSYNLPIAQLLAQANDAMDSPMERLEKEVDVEDMDTYPKMLDTEPPRTSKKRKEKTLPTFFNQSDKGLKKARAEGLVQSRPIIEPSP
jgi:hypothetical protein